MNALRTRYLELGLIIPELEDRNPAGNHDNYNYRDYPNSMYFCNNDALREICTQKAII